jgi:hypothetical protein
MAATDSEIPREYESGMDGVFLQGPTPPISLDMAIDSPVWQLSTGNDGRPKLIFTITSHLNHPITLRTHGTVLDTRNPYRGIFIHQRLTIKDIDTGLRICFSGSEPQLAYPPRRRLGTSDERGFTTLQPGQPITVSYGVPCLSYNERFDGGSKGQLTFTPRGAELGGEIFSRYFEPGHRYRIGIQNRIKRRFRDQVPEREDFQVRFWWRYGLKEEVMAPPGTTPEGGGYIGWSEHEIQINGIPDVEMACEK